MSETAFSYAERKELEYRVVGKDETVFMNTGGTLPYKGVLIEVVNEDSECRYYPYYGRSEKLALFQVKLVKWECLCVRDSYEMFLFLR